jgi:enamine deaminase RidA (YjgF/YER057c/UK114 family)
MRKLILPALASGLALAASAANAEIVHIGAPTAAIASAVTAPAPVDTIYVSGITPSAVDPAKPTEFGDTKAQTISIITKIGDILKAQGYGFGDVVMMRVYLVGDPAKAGKMDFAGMMEGYTQFFGTKDQPNKPARVTMQVSALVNPAFLCEIELQAAKPAAMAPAKAKK